MRAPPPGFAFGDSHFFPWGVDAEEDEKEDGEAPERRAAVAEKGQGDADHGGESEHHADVDDEVKEDDGGYTVTVDAPEKGVLSLGQRDESHDP